MGGRENAIGYGGRIQEVSHFRALLAPQKPMAGEGWAGVTRKARPKGNKEGMEK